MSTPIDLHSPETCVRAVQALLSVSLVIGSFQNLYNTAQYSSGGLLSWKFLKYAYQYKIFESKAVDILFGATSFLLLNIARIALAIAAVAENTGNAGNTENAHPEVLTALFIIQGLLYIRAFLVTSAADQLNTIILLFLLVCAWLPIPAIQTLSLCALAIQTLFCYFANGLIKSMAHRWRDGSHLKAILLTENYSRKWLARQIEKRQIEKHETENRQIENPKAKNPEAKNPGTENPQIARPPTPEKIPPLFKYLSTTVIVWETAAILVPFLPEPLVWLFLGIGLCFHAIVATVMGLNTFFWTFVSTYPAILFLQYEVSKLCP